MVLSNNQLVKSFLFPKSVVIIGASTNPKKVGSRIVKNLIDHKFGGKIYPVNPKGGNVFGIEIKKNIFEIEENVDLGVLAGPNKLIPNILKDCIKKGVLGVIIEAAGYEEVGDFGLVNQIKEITENYTKIRILGPNCLGITSLNKDNEGFFSAFNPVTVLRGDIAVISQSGFLNGGYLTYLEAKYPGVGFRYIASVGNKSDLSETEFLEYFIQDDTVKIISIYLESFKYPRKFLELAKKARKMPDKTIILLKGGVSEQGKKATKSHTGAISEDSRLTEGLIKQSGVIQAASFHELFQVTRTFSMIYSAGLQMPKEGKFAFLTTSGGAGTVSTDLLTRYGLEFPQLGEEQYNTIAEIYPEWMKPNKFALLDLWPAMEHQASKGKRGIVYRVTLEALFTDPNIEVIGTMVFCDSHTENFVDLLIEYQNKYKKPLFCWLVGPTYHEIAQKFDRNNIPNFLNLENLVRNYRALL
ncbi:MAG: CoA-binding protein [Promethearchaeota archaeon]